MRRPILDSVSPVTMIVMPSYRISAVDAGTAVGEKDKERDLPWLFRLDAKDRGSSLNTIEPSRASPTAMTRSPTGSPPVKIPARPESSGRWGSGWVVP